MKVIAIAGGSGVGKSTLARVLARALSPRTCVILSEDDYYKDLSRQPGFDPATCSFDEPWARDHARLVADLKRMRQGEAIMRPVYAFTTHSRRARGVRTEPAEVVILEGLHVLYEAEVRALADLAVYLEVDADLRFIRRLKRDISRRGRTVSSILDQYLRAVKPAHHLYVAPSRAHADLVLRESGALAAEDMALQHRAWAKAIADALMAKEED